MGKDRGGPTGVVVVDKPKGKTSHDVVAMMRKRLSTRRVGHAGTLDPMATGVLVIMVGEATKLGPYLTADDKRYEAEVTFGRGTDSLDADGEVVAEAPLPEWWAAEGETRLRAALEAETSRAEQKPPALSAIKVKGKSAHKRVRAGETVDLPPRPVAVRKLGLHGIDGDRARINVDVAKGYYVRSLARDLGEALALPSHLTALRRTASGTFLLDEALAPEMVTEERLVPLAQAAARALPTRRLTAVGVAHAQCGGPMRDGDFEEIGPEGASAWLGPDGRLIAIGTHTQDGAAQVLRGFREPEEG